MLILVGSEGTKYSNTSQLTTTRAIIAAIPWITLARTFLNIVSPAHAHEHPHDQIPY
jgi:hypothetical protein